ncbi:MAG: hypothetical protein WC012_03695 [Thiohalomonadaceae bacterium]
MSDIMFQPLGKKTLAANGLDSIADIDPRLTRTHYFDGRLLTAEDLTRDQIYVDQRLRELGRVLGNGIMGGLELSFDCFTGVLTLQPGQALTPAGRVLELGSPLEVNLGDRALISSLNDGNYRRFNRALYAVVLRYAEVNTDIAEVFPKDLSARRGFEYATVTESVQMGLVPLPLPLPQQSPLLVRSRLMAELFGNDLSGTIPEDAVALGILAIQDDTPQWLDAELLRHPVRAEPEPSDRQADLSRQYEKLLTDILTARTSGGLSGDFHATDYFSLLPPVGTLPKDAVDPVKGRQGFFPENYQVAIAPIRHSDIELIKAESLALPPINLSGGEPVNVMVLVPLSNYDYGIYASPLEREYDAASRRLPQIDPLRLKLYPIRSPHALDTDAPQWQALWDRLGSNQPFYVRRPSRAAENAISGIVLALGAPVLAPEEAVEGGNPAIEGGLIQDEDAVFLSRMGLNTLAELRPPQDEAGQKAVDDMALQFGGSAYVVRQTALLLTLMGREYDLLTWQTLYALAGNGYLEDFRLVIASSDPGIPLPQLVVDSGEAMMLEPGLISQWADLVP